MPLQIIRQDITQMQVDAIVNPTNEEMVGYSGIDLAVHTAAGQELAMECATLAPLGLGQAKLSGGYRLHCKYVIHTSGPVWKGGLMGESIILRSCYIESMKLALQNGCETVAFPLISSGAYGYPKEQVLKFAIQTITEFLFEHELSVYLCVFDRESYTFSQKLFKDIAEFIDDKYAEGCRRALSESYYRRRNADSVQMYRMIEPMKAAEVGSGGTQAKKSLREYLKQRDRSFQEMLFDLIDERDMRDVECYKRANVDKRTFSKIKSNREYRPSKATAVAFAIALRLDITETQELLAAAGFALSDSKVFDKIIKYFIYNGNHDIFEINEALFEFDQQLLGSL